MKLIETMDGGSLIEVKCYLNEAVTLDLQSGLTKIIEIILAVTFFRSQLEDRLSAVRRNKFLPGIETHPK